VRVIVAVPPGGFGQRIDRISAWLDENCGADGWAITPAGRAVVNDAIAVYLRDASFTAAFVSRWCAGEVDGVYQVRDDEPTPRVPAGHHKTPDGKH
jgi:hypothetical protein